MMKMGDVWSFPLDEVHRSQDEQHLEGWCAYSDGPFWPIGEDAKNLYNGLAGAYGGELYE